MDDDGLPLSSPLPLLSQPAVQALNKNPDPRCQHPETTGVGRITRASDTRNELKPPHLWSVWWGIKIATARRDERNGLRVMEVKPGTGAVFKGGWGRGVGVV